MDLNKIRTIVLGLMFIFVLVTIILTITEPNQVQCKSLKLIKKLILKKKEIKILQHIAVAATVLGKRKKFMLPLPLVLPVPFPIIHNHQPIISPEGIDLGLAFEQKIGSKFGKGGLGAIGGLVRK